MTNDCDLSAKEQRLLYRYFDGECNALSRFLARRLMSKNPLANRFIESLHSQSEILRATRASQPQSVDLWRRIDARIEQETRASFYLGERRVKDSRPSAWERLAPSNVVFGGLSGAAIAAAALFVIYQPRNFITFSSPQAITLNQSKEFQPVGLTARGAQQARPAAQTFPGHLEVDWMRSHGSLALIPDSNGNSTIIWVKRRNQFAPSRQLSASTQPTPLGRAIPTATIPTRREWLDGRAVGSAK